MSTMTAEQSKGQRSLEGRSEDAVELLQGLDSDDMDARDEAMEALDSFALSVEVVKHVRIVLGTGGPHDELDVTLWDDGTVREVNYFYAWGSERFERRVYEGDPLYRIAENYAEYVTEL